MLKLLIHLLFLAVLLSPVAFGIAAFEREATLPPSAALSPKQAAKSKDLVKRTRRLAQETRGEATITAAKEELDGLIAVAARIVKPLRGATEIDTEGVWVEVSAQVPGLASLGWVNAAGHVAASEHGLEVRRLKLGHMSLPPGLTVALVRVALDASTSQDVGTMLLGSVRSVATQPGEVEVVVDTGGLGDDSLFSQAVDGVREAAGLGGGDAARAHFEALAKAAADGRLPRQGSVAPWLSLTLRRVVDAGHSDVAAQREDLRAALLALAAHCGSLKAIETMAGDLSGADNGPTACTRLTLGGRPDLRQHFTLSAALAASSGAAASFGLGEVKELVDAGRKRGSGFSFDDIAADRAGIRFHKAALAARLEGLAALADLAVDETAVMPSIDGLPSFLSDEEFRARYRDVDSAAYADQIAEIDGRIARLAIHAR